MGATGMADGVGDGVVAGVRGEVEDGYVEGYEGGESWGWRFVRGAWPVLGIGVGMVVIGACLLAPQIEQNREVRGELLALRAEQARVEAQVAANEAFLERLGKGDDPTLTARLAHRQLRILPDGTEALELAGVSEEMRSPFQMVRAAGVGEVDAKAGGGGGFLAGLKLPGFLGDGRTRLYLMAGAMMLVGAGLICDGSRRSRG